MQDVHVLVDLENNQPTLDEVRKLVPNLTDAWLFHGKQQTKRLQSFESMGERRTAVPITRPGKNSLDFHLAFYLGYIARKDPNAKLVVVAIDGGYEPMILHAKELGFDVRKVAFKSKAAPAKEATAKQKPTTKNSPAAKKIGPAAEKLSAKRALVAKKLPAKKASTVSRPMAKAVAAKNAQPQTGASITGKASGQATAKKAISSLSKMGDKRPRTLKPFRRHIGSLIGPNAAQAAVDHLISELKRKGALTISGDTVTYHQLVTRAS